MSIRQPTNSSASALRQIMRAARVIARNAVALAMPDWKLDFNLKHSVWIQAFQKLFGLHQVETFVAHFYDEEKAVVGRQGEARDVEHRVVRRGQTVHRQHAEYGAQRGAQHREFEGDRNKRRPAVVRFAADVQRITDHVRVILHEEAGEAAEQPADEDDHGQDRAVEADGFGQSLDRQRRKRVNLLVAGVVGAVRGFQKFVGRLELGQQSVKWFALHKTNRESPDWDSARARGTWCAGAYSSHPVNRSCATALSIWRRGCWDH